MISSPIMAMTTPIMAIMKRPVRTPAIRITVPTTAMIAPAMRIRHPISMIVLGGRGWFVQVHQLVFRIGEPVFARLWPLIRRMVR